MRAMMIHACSCFWGSSGAICCTDCIVSFKVACDRSARAVTGAGCEKSRPLEGAPAQSTSCTASTSDMREGVISFSRGRSWKSSTACCRRRNSLTLWVLRVLRRLVEEMECRDLSRGLEWVEAESGVCGLAMFIFAFFDASA